MQTSMTSPGKSLSLIAPPAIKSQEKRDCRGSLLENDDTENNDRNRR